MQYEGKNSSRPGMMVRVYRKRGVCDLHANGAQRLDAREGDDGGVGRAIQALAEEACSGAQLPSPLFLPPPPLLLLFGSLVLESGHLGTSALLGLSSAVASLHVVLRIRVDVNVVVPEKQSRILSV